MSSARFSSVADWLRWQEQLHATEMDFGLERIGQVFAELFHEGYRKPVTITVAGTNGKGSCVTALATLLAAQGLSVGSFISPHLFCYNERIRLNMQPVDDSELLEAFAAIDQARGEVSLTYFEFNALAAFYVFNKHHVDVQVLEVGLGGRLDAVNLLDAHHCVITNIALDHTDWLGDSRELIGAEKVGILRRHSHFVYGEADMPASVAARAAQLHCTPDQLGVAFRYHLSEGRFYWQGAHGQKIDCEPPSLPLPSVACALQVLAELGIFDIKVIENVLPAIRLPGRMQRVQQGEQTFIFDVAHNPHGAEFLVRALQAQGEPPLTIIYSAMRDKDMIGTLTALAPLASHWIVFPLADNPRAATAEQLRQALQQLGVTVPVVEVGNAAEACAAAKTKTVLVCGSFFTVAALQQEMLGEGQ